MGPPLREHRYLWGCSTLQGSRCRFLLGLRGVLPLRVGRCRRRDLRVVAIVWLLCGAGSDRMTRHGRQPN